MTKVLFGGSRSIFRLSAKVRQRIDNVLSKGFFVLIGDANGADKAIQAYLAQKKYLNVTVFCSGTVCRNNLGNWCTEFVGTDRKRPDFRHYSEKDARMAQQADYGLFLWDGKSKGTLNNILRLVTRKRPVLVYVSPRKAFVTIKAAGNLGNLISKCDPQTIKTLWRVTKMSERVAAEQSRLGLV